MNIHLFGASSISGIAFSNLFKIHLNDYRVIPYSSKNKKFNLLNLKNYKNHNLLDNKLPSIIVSFAPIWFLSEYLEKANKLNPEIFSQVKGIIVCSSSSSLTKKFSSNNFDKNLSRTISNSEKKY